MHEWIQHTKYRVKRFMTWLDLKLRLAPGTVYFPEEKQLIKVSVWDDVKLAVHRYRKECGCPGHTITMWLYVDDLDRWLEIAWFTDDELHAVLTLLSGAVNIIDAERTPKVDRSVVGD